MKKRKSRKKIIQWAKDVARLDPTPLFEDEVDVKYDVPLATLTMVMMKATIILNKKRKIKHARSD